MQNGTSNAKQNILYINHVKTYFGTFTFQYLETNNNLTLYTSTGACFDVSLDVLVFILRRFFADTSSLPMLNNLLEPKRTQIL